MRTIFTEKRCLALAITAALAAPVAGLAQEAVELRSLDGGDGLVLTGIAANDQSGYSVSGAGDVNGDGIADVIIGARFADPGAVSGAGQSYVVFGSDGDFLANLSLADLNGSNGFAINGILASDNSGVSVSGAGDINGDGIDDVVIGADEADPTAPNSSEGQTYVVFGSNSGFPPSLNLSGLNGSNGFVLNGILPNDDSGFSVSGAGDVNGDGIDDLIIGALFADPDGNSGAGESYVVFGSDLGFASPINLADLNGSNGFLLKGIDAGDNSGRSVSGAGDVNGDGFDDLIIGANNADPGTNSEGETYLVFGFDNPLITEISLTGLNGANGVVLNGVLPSDDSGFSVSDAGDINGDGLSDVIIGATYADPGSNSNAGQSYVVFGSDSVPPYPASLNLVDLNGSNGFALNGIDISDQSGRSVSGAGDVNGDGIDDVIIGGRDADPGGNSSAGESYVVFGSDAGFAASINLADLNGPNGFVLNGIDQFDDSGESVSGAGDVNGDGIDDLIIGANDADPGGNSGAGESYLVFGNGAPLAVGSQALLFNELEGDLNSAGSRLDFTVAAHYLDMDPFGGVAVINDADTSVQGDWQYSSDGVNWVPVPGGLSDSNALVLSDTHLLRYRPAVNFAGQPGPLTLRLWDGRWREPGEGVDITNAVGALGGFATDDNLLDVTVNILQVNDAPSFSASSPPAVNEDPGGVTVAGWSSFNPGQANEANQFALAYQVENISNPGLFSVLPTIGTLGNLVYDSKQDVSGSSSFDVRVVDSGGMANGGVNVSGFQTFTITVNPVNDPPRILADDPPNVVVDAGPQTVTNWATFDPGAFNETGQSPTYQVTSVADPGLFATAPSVDAAGNLSYTPAAGLVGSSTFTVQVSDDGGTANGGSDTSAPTDFTIDILANEIFSDSFEN